MQEYLEKLNPEQKEMATTIDGPVFTLAGAGSGKTHTMITRLAYMIKSGIQPENILLLTFTNKAADEMKERAKIMVGDVADKVTALTYHSFCVRMLRQHSGYAGLRHDFTVISQGDVDSAISLVKTEMKLDKIKGFPNTKTIAGWISATINTDSTFADLMENTKYKAFIPEVAKIKERYLEYKREREYLDYDDMLVLFLETLKNHPDLAEKIANTYTHIMCDETQDENNIQTGIIDILRKEIKNICIVGDDGQCLPEGTLIKTEKGYIKIEDLYDNYLGEKILCASGRDKSMFGKIDEVFRKKYDGELVSIKTKSGKSIAATPEHIIFVDSTVLDAYFVYMMYKPSVGFRIGQSKCHTKANGNAFDRNGYESRVQQEGAERAWLLYVTKNEADSRYYEQYYSYKYGIPMYVFNEGERSVALKQPIIDKLFHNINTFGRALVLLQDLGLSFDEPHYINNYKTQGKQRMLKRLSYTLFGEGRQRPNGKYGSELSFNTIDIDIAKAGQKVFGTVPSKKKNVYGTEYYNGRKVLLDHDLLMDYGIKMTIEKPELYFHRRAKLIENHKPFEFMPFRNLREGMKICIEENGKIVEDEIVSVNRENYEGYVYDINIKEFRNYLADDIVVHNCLYSWRGANVHNFLSFPSRYPDCKKITLFRNYRSTQEILDLANNVMNTHMTEGIKKEMKGNKNGEKPELINVRDQEEEAEFILNKIRLLKSEGLNYSDIAILERMATQSLHLEGLLTQANIPYVKYGGIKFLERADVVDILSYLRVVANPTDELAWYRVLKTYEGIGNTYGEKLSKLAVKEKCELLINNPFKTHKFYSTLQDLHSLIFKWRDMDLNKMIPDIIEHYIDNKEKIAKEGIRIAVEIEAIEKAFKDEKDELSVLSSIASKYSSLSEYLDSFILDQSREEEKKDAVVISTIHSAKGLEWNTVFLLDTVDGFCPMTNFAGEADEEELRCFYVAITRPKERLYMLKPNIIIKWGKPEASVLSRYLKNCEAYYNYKRANGRLLSA